MLDWKARGLNAFDPEGRRIIIIIIIIFIIVIVFFYYIRVRP